MLTVSKEAGDGRVYHYTPPTKSPFHVNHKFEKKVNDALGHIVRFTEVNNGQNSSNFGTCSWDSSDVGTPDQIAGVILRVASNYAGYQIADPNITATTTQQDLLHVHLLKMHRHLTFISTCTATMFVEMYECIPRRDLYNNSAHITNYDPSIILQTLGQAGDLVDQVGAESMSVYDPRFTPYMCPLLVQNWKIVSARKFKVKPGGMFTANISSNNKMLIKGVDFNYNTAQFRRKTSKVLLWKIYGQLGVATETEEPMQEQIRHMPVSMAFKVYDEWEARAAPEKRKIYDDAGGAHQDGDFSVGQFINEETDSVTTANKILADNTN